MGFTTGRELHPALKIGCCSIETNYRNFISDCQTEKIKNYYNFSPISHVDTCNLSTEEVSRTVHIHARQKDLHGYTGHDAKEKGCTVNFPAGENVTSVNYPRGDDAVLWSAGETFCADVTLRYYHPASLNGKCIDWSLTCGNTVAASGSIELPEETHGLHSCGTISFSCPACKKAAMYQLNLSIAGTGIQNHYELYLYPAMDSVDLSVPQITRNGHSISLTNDWKQACALLSEGKRVLYLPEEVSESLEGFYCTDFWCYPMFRDICNWMKKPVAVGTMGLLIQQEHPALHSFCSHSYATPQWYAIVSHSRCAILDDCTNAGYHPIVQIIDNFERNHKLGILMEGNAGAGKLMICTSRLSEITERPEVRQFTASVLDYMTSDAFAPSQTLDIEKLSHIFA